MERRDQWLKKAVFVGKAMEFTQANGRKKSVSGEFEIVSRTARAVVLKQGKMIFSIPTYVFRRNFMEV